MTTLTMRLLSPHTPHFDPDIKAWTALAEDNAPIQAGSWYKCWLELTRHNGRLPYTKGIDHEK